MKKYVLALLAAGSMGAAQAQTGSILLAGDLSFTSNKDEAETKTTEFAINPLVGYQINSFLTVGLLGGVQTHSEKPKVGDATKSTDFKIGAFVRHSYPVGRIFSLYGQLALGYQGQGETKTGDVVVAPKSSGFFAELTPNVGINVYRGFGLNFGYGGLSYTSMKMDVSNAKAASEFKLTFGQQFHVGVSKNFGGEKKYRGHHGMMDETRRIDTSDDEGDDDAPKRKKKSHHDHGDF
jgi:hypothetical protein